MRDQRNPPALGGATGPRTNGGPRSWALAVLVAGGLSVAGLAGPIASAGAAPGPPTFDPWAPVGSVRGTITGAAAGDLDGTGPDEIVTVDEAAGLSVFSRPAVGEAYSRTSVPVPGNPYGVAIADVDGDGRDEIVTANVDGGSVSVVKRSAPGPGYTTRTTTGLPGGPLGVAVGDLDGDGQPEIAVSTAGPNTVQVLRRGEAGGWTVERAGGVGSYPDGVAIGDVDGDRRPDLVTSDNFGGGITVLARSAGSEAYTARTVRLASQLSGVAIGDLDGDGRRQIVTAESTGSRIVATSIDRGTGEVRTRDLGTGRAGPLAPAIGDLNGDGRPDVVVADRSGSTLTVLTREATGDGYANTAVPVDSFPSAVALEDLDGDGRTDIAAGTAFATVGAVRNTSLFPPAITIASPVDGAEVTAGDELRASYACAPGPGGSAVASCDGTVADGALVDTGTPGEKRFTVSSSDAAGNTTTRSVTYTVERAPAPPTDPGTPTTPTVPTPPAPTPTTPTPATPAQPPAGTAPTPPRGAASLLDAVRRAVDTSRESRRILRRGRATIRVANAAPGAYLVRLRTRARRPRLVAVGHRTVKGRSAKTVRLSLRVTRYGRGYLARRRAAGRHVVRLRASATYEPAVGRGVTTARTVGWRVAAKPGH